MGCPPWLLIKVGTVADSTCMMKFHMKKFQTNLPYFNRIAGDLARFHNIGDGFKQYIRQVKSILFFVIWCLGGGTGIGQLISTFKIFNADAVRKGFAIRHFLTPFYLR